MERGEPGTEWIGWVRADDACCHGPRRMVSLDDAVAGIGQTWVYA